MLKNPSPWTPLYCIFLFLPGMKEFSPWKVDDKRWHSIASLSIRTGGFFHILCYIVFTVLLFKVNTLFNSFKGECFFYETVLTGLPYQVFILANQCMISGGKPLVGQTHDTHQYYLVFNLNHHTFNRKGIKPQSSTEP